MTGGWQAAALAAAASWLLCNALARAVPLRGRDAAGLYLKRKAVRTAGRLVIVVAVVAAGAGGAGGDPVAVTAGALAGWLAAALAELLAARGRGGDVGAKG
ncbi:MAG: hypothetical protein MUF27_01835 [Acidobacteria bacterium]|nr:hypothetical protein [Acidobacteriota bacterium]